MPTSIRLAEDTEQRLSALASRTGRTKAFYLREIIERGLEEAEDYYLASETLSRVRNGDEGVMSLVEMERALAVGN